MENMKHFKEWAPHGGWIAAVLLLASVASAQPKKSDAGMTESLTSKMDVSEKQATEGAGAVFALAESRMSPENFSELKNAVPEVSQMLEKSGLEGKVSSMPDLVKNFRSMGLSRGQVKEFITNLVGHIKEVAGPQDRRAIARSFGKPLNPPPAPPTQAR